MHQIIEVLISGIMLGAIYALLSFGLSLVYGVTRILNFAYGSLYTVGGYVVWVLTVGYLELGYEVAFLILIPTLFVLGMALERLVIRPLRWKPDWNITTMMVTLGAAFFIDNANLIIFGPENKVLLPLVTGKWEILGFVVSLHRIVIFILAIVLLLALDLFLRKTWYGQAMRAVAQDMQGANMVGINVNQIFGYAFGLSTVLAGLAGVLLAPIHLISPFVGWSPFLKAFVIVVLGGLGSTRGTLVAAFMLGIVESYAVYWAGASWTMPLWLLLLLAVLAFRPHGLFGSWT
jgi:branched-chain amino acid transport system permease protein